MAFYDLLLYYAAIPILNPLTVRRLYRLDRLTGYCSRQSHTLRLQSLTAWIFYLPRRLAALYSFSFCSEQLLYIHSFSRSTVSYSPPVPKSYQHSPPMNPHILAILRLYQALYRLDSDSPQAFTKVVSYRPYHLSPSTAAASYSPIVYPPLLWLFHTVLSSTPLYCGYFIRILSSTALHCGCFIQLYRLRPFTAAASCSAHRLPPSMLVAPYNP